MSEEKAETIEVKGDNLVKNCAYCGAEFDGRISTNKWHQCPLCDSQFLVRIKPASQERASTNHKL